MDVDKQCWEAQFSSAWLEEWKSKFGKLNEGQIVEILTCQTRNLNCILKPEGAFTSFEESHGVLNLLWLS